MLKRIQELLLERNRLSMRELALILHTEPSALEPMMETLVRKGRVELLDAGCGGKSCRGCCCSSRNDMMVYRMLEN